MDVKRVFKYEVPIKDETGFFAPIGAELLHIAPGPNEWTLHAWVLVNPENRVKTEFGLYIVGTGRPVPDDLYAHNFFTTVIAPPFVWHVWRAGAW